MYVDFGVRRYSRGLRATPNRWCQFESEVPAVPVSYPTSQRTTDPGEVWNWKRQSRYRSASHR